MLIIFITLSFISKELHTSSDPITQNIVTSLHSFISKSTLNVFSPIPFYFFILEISSHFKDECNNKIKESVLSRPQSFNMYGPSPSMGPKFLDKITKPNSTTTSFLYLTESVIFEGDQWTIGDNYIDPSIKTYFEVIQPYSSPEKTKLTKDVVQKRLKSKSYDLLEIDSDHSIGSSTIDVFISYSVLFYSLNDWTKKVAPPEDKSKKSETSAFFPNRTFHTSPINVYVGTTNKSEVHFVKINKGDDNERKIWLAFTFFDLERETISMVEYVNNMHSFVSGNAKDAIHKLDKKAVDSKYYLPMGSIKNIVNFKSYFTTLLQDTSGRRMDCFDPNKYQVTKSDGNKQDASNVFFGDIYGENILKIEERGIFMTSLFGESFSLTEVNDQGSFDMINQGMFLTVLIDSETTDYEILFTNKVVGTKGEQYKWIDVSNGKKQVGIGLIGVLFIIAMIIIGITVFNIVYRKEESLKNAMPFGNAISNFVNMLRGKKKRYIMTNYNMNETNFLEH